MKFSEIYEDIKGDTVFSTEYRHLYHLTDHHGFAYTIDRNALRTKGYSYVSTTYDPKMNGYVGGDHADFKFILNGKLLAKDYGVFSYDAYTTEIGSGESRRVSLNEREIGINTSSIEPFTKYVEGLVLLFNPFSRKGIQWMFYENPERKPSFSPAKSSAPRAIEMFLKFRDDWGLPIYMGSEGRLMKQKEVQIFRDFEKMHEDGLSFQEALRKTVELHHGVEDHFGRVLDTDILDKEKKSKRLIDKLNEYFTSKKISQLDSKKTRRLIKMVMESLGLGHNQMGAILSAAEQYNFFHPVVAPIDWSIVIKDLVYGDVDDAIDYMARKEKEYEFRRERYEDPDERKYSGTHVKAFSG